MIADFPIDANLVATRYALAFVNDCQTEGEKRVIEQKKAEFFEWLRQHDEATHEKAYTSGVEDGIIAMEFDSSSNLRPNRPNPFRKQP